MFITPHIASRTKENIERQGIVAAENPYSGVKGSYVNKVIALVPMKGHSERIPKKNLKLLNGIPLYHFIVNSLQNSQAINKIYINTDCPDIAKDVQNNFPNIQIIQRPKDLIGDYVSMNKIIAYDLSQIEGEHFLQTHSTNPLITSRTIDQAIDIYFKNIDNRDSLFSVTPHHSRFFSPDLSPINHDPNKLGRTQDINPIYEENSNIYSIL